MEKLEFKSKLNTYIEKSHKDFTDQVLSKGSSNPELLREIQKRIQMLEDLKAVCELRNRY